MLTVASSTSNKHRLLSSHTSAHRVGHDLTRAAPSTIMAAGSAAARRRASTKTFDKNVTRVVSSSSKVAAEERKAKAAGIGAGTLGAIGIAILVVVVVGSSIVDILRPNL
jgi:preprotein translocase subunit Sss1